MDCERSWMVATKTLNTANIKVMDMNPERDIDRILSQVGESKNEQREGNDAIKQKIIEVYGTSHDQVEAYHKLKEQGYSVTLRQVREATRGIRPKGGGATVQRKRQGDVTRIPSEAVYARLTEQVTGEVLGKYEKIMSVGRDTVEAWEYEAEVRGMQLPDFIEECVNFYLVNHDKFVNIEQENAQLKQMAYTFFQVANPYYQKRDMLKLMIMAKVMGVDLEVRDAK